MVDYPSVLITIIFIVVIVILRKFTHKYLGHLMLRLRWKFTNLFKKTSIDKNNSVKSMSINKDILENAINNVEQQYK